MADGRDVGVWDRHAGECRDAKRSPFEFPIDDSKGGWLRKRVLEVLTPGAKALDLGCGPGYWRNLFEGFVYTGFDQSTEMLRLAAEMPPELTWVQGNAREVSNHFGPGTFDMVFTASVLQHNRHDPDKREIVEAVSKILKPHGYFLMTENTYRKDNCPQSVGQPEYTDGYSFTHQGWEKFMNDLGYNLVGRNDHSEYLFIKV